MQNRYKMNIGNNNKEAGFDGVFRNKSARLSVLPAFLLFVVSSCSNPALLVSSLPSLDLLVAKGARSFVVDRKVDLLGTTVKLPEGTHITFRSGGSLNNGTLSGTFSVDGVTRSSLNVYVKKGSRITSVLPVYNHESEVNRSLMSAAESGIELCEDIIIDSAVVLKSNLNGNNHSIYASNRAASAIRIENNRSPICISNVSIIKAYESGTINRNYALNVRNSSNVSVVNSSLEGRIRVVNATMSDDEDKVSENFLFSKCRLTCDLSVCPQGAVYGQDHIGFYSIKNITIEDCEIVSRNVNRVLKTSEYFPEKEYAIASRCTENVVFRHNQVDAVSAYGKQMWDMYCGTLDVLITGNNVRIEGFTRFVEDKAYQPKQRKGQSVVSSIQIIENTVVAHGADIFQFLANRENDTFVVKGNSFVLCGPNTNPNTGFSRAAGFYLQGYKSAVITNNTFDFQDEACGLVVGKVNFQCDSTLIADNVMQDAHRVYFAQANHPKRGSERVQCSYFGYKNNNKKYSKNYREERGELLVASADIDELDVDIADNETLGYYMIAFAKDSKVGVLRYSSQGSGKNAFYSLSKGVSLKTIQGKDRFVQKDIFWSFK